MLEIFKNEYYVIVIVIDNENDYCSVSLKKDKISHLITMYADRFKYFKSDINNSET